MSKARTSPPSTTAAATARTASTARTAPGSRARSVRAGLLALSAVAVLTVTATACRQEDGSAARGTTVSGASSDRFGSPIVSDASGFTLYRFDEDTADPSATTCVDKCAEAWPPVIAEGDLTGAKGVDGKLLGTVERPDGSKQVTLGGWPLYRFAKDTKPGDTRGQGVRGTWFASDPAGGKATEADPGTAQDPAGSTGTDAGAGPGAADEGADARDGGSGSGDKYGSGHGGQYGY